MRVRVSGWGLGLVEVVVGVIAEEREVVVVVARGHEREDVTASSGTLGKENGALRLRENVCGRV